MTENLIIGLLVTAIPGFVLGYLMLSKQPAIFRMFIAMVLVGLGYLDGHGSHGGHRQSRDRQAQRHRGSC